MNKLKMTSVNTLVFKDGCDMYLDYCRQRNLKQGTINHYRQSYLKFYEYFDPNMLVRNLTQMVLFGLLSQSRRL